jgi:hypothetical protein
LVTGELVIDDFGGLQSLRDARQVGGWLVIKGVIGDE